MPALDHRQNETFAACDGGTEACHEAAVMSSDARKPLQVAGRGCDSPEASVMAASPWVATYGSAAPEWRGAPQVVRVLALSGHEPLDAVWRGGERLRRCLRIAGINRVSGGQWHGVRAYRRGGGPSGAAAARADRSPCLGPSPPCATRRASTCTASVAVPHIHSVLARAASPSRQKVRRAQHMRTTDVGVAVARPAGPKGSRHRCERPAAHPGPGQIRRHRLPLALPGQGAPPDPGGARIWRASGPRLAHRPLPAPRRPSPCAGHRC